MVQGDKKGNLITLRLPRLQEAQPRSGTIMHHCAHSPLRTPFLVFGQVEAKQSHSPTAIAHSFPCLRQVARSARGNPSFFLFPCHSELVSESPLFVFKR